MGVCILNFKENCIFRCNFTNEGLHIIEKAVNFENREGPIRATPTNRPWYVKNLEERFNTISHLLGGILMIFGTIFLLIRSLLARRPKCVVPGVILHKIKLNRAEALFSFKF